MKKKTNPYHTSEEHNMYEQTKQFKYDVFISYRHAPLDSAVAGYIQKALERYRVPAEIRRKTGKKKITRVFRDQEELGVSSDLYQEIREQLSQSEYLVLILSPRTRESPWVLREIETFLEFRSREYVLPVLVEGEPCDTFPDILSRDSKEPLAADFRGKSIKEALRNARRNLPRLVAPILHCSYAELVQRAKVYKMKRLAALSGVIAAAGICISAFTAWQYVQIRTNYQEKLANQSRYLARQSADLLSQGRREEALLVALEALPKNSGDTSRPFVGEAMTALQNGLYTYYDYGTSTIYPMKRLELKAVLTDRVQTGQANGTELFSVMDVEGRVYVIDPVSMEILTLFEDRTYQKALFASDSRIILESENSLYCMDCTDGSLMWQWDFAILHPEDQSDAIRSSSALQWVYSQTLDQVICFNRSSSTLDGEFVLYQILASEGTETVRKHPFGSESEQPAGSITDISLSPDGCRAAVSFQCGRDTASPEPYISGYLYRIMSLDLEENLTSPITDIHTSIGTNMEWIDSRRLLTVSCQMLSETGAVLNSGHEHNDITLWDTDTAEPLWHNTTSSITGGTFRASEIDCGKEGEGPSRILLFRKNNVIMTMDPETGSTLKRMEDFNQIVFGGLIGRFLGFFITDNSYCFTTSLNNSFEFQEHMTEYRYSLGLTPITAGIVADSRIFLLSGSSLCYYSNPVSENGICLDPDLPMRNGFFSPSGHYLSVKDDQNRIHIIDASTGQILWSDDCVEDQLKRYTDAAFISEERLVYHGAEADEIRIYEMGDDAPRKIHLTDFHPEENTDGLQNIFLNACSARGEQFTAWGMKQEWATENIPSFSPCLWILDSTGTTEPVFYGESFFSQLKEDGSDGVWLLQASLAGNGRFLILFCCNYKQIGVFYEIQSMDTRCRIFDLQTEQMLFLPELEQAVFTDTLSRTDRKLNTYTYPHWIAPDQKHIALYSDDRTVRIFDLEAGRQVRILQTDGVSSRELCFTPDSRYLIFQDAALCLNIYDWKHERYIQKEYTPGSSSAAFGFNPDATKMYIRYQTETIYKENVSFYQRKDDDTWQFETDVSACCPTNGDKLVTAGTHAVKLHDYYTLDDLIRMAEEILDGRELTPEERRMYLIDN